MSLDTGQIIDGKYRIVRLLGQGGMGAVYEGENTRIKRRVAIKVLHAAVSQNAETVARFEREAQAAARIGSEHICEVLDLGVLPDGTRYMVMEYLDGETLGARIKRQGRLTPAQSIAVLSQTLDALGAAHAAGIVHRDLKPDNIFILPQKGGRADFVKILDFGVSKFSQLSGEGEEMNVTRAGSVVGTPYYMSPEQARGMATVDARSDIYAIGVVLYQATTGQVPFRAETFNELLFKIALEVPPPPHHFVPDIDPDFAAIIQRAMSREQAHRFQSCAEFRDALLAWQAARTAGGPVPVLPGGRLATLSPGAGLSSSGVVPPGNVPFATPQPGMQTPLPASGPFAASTPGAQTPPVVEPGQSTGAAWGNASSAPVEPKKSSAMTIVSALVAVVVLGGLGVAGYFVFGKHAETPAPAASAAQTVAPPAPSPSPTLAAPPPTQTAVVAPPPVESATAPSPTASAVASSMATTAPMLMPWPSAKPLGSAKPAGSGKTNKNNGIPGDFGY
jgi:serine/threonine-protein kinase